MSPALPGISSKHRLGLTFSSFSSFFWGGGGVLGWSSLCSERSTIGAEYKSLKKTNSQSQTFLKLLCNPQLGSKSSVPWLAELSLGALEGTWHSPFLARLAQGDAAALLLQENST